MPHHAPAAAVLALLLAATSACSAPIPQPEATPAVTEIPIKGFVTDLPAFEQFLAGRPTPAQLKARYPDLTVVLPGEIASKEFRMNNSRYFATLGEDGRISGGKFQ